MRVFGGEMREKGGLMSGAAARTGSYKGKRLKNDIINEIIGVL